MGLFGNYMNTGAGINPNAPKKKPFFRFWEILWRNIGKIISLNLLYTALHAPLLLSIPVLMETNNKLTYAMTVFLLLLQVVLEGPILTGCARVLRLIVLDKAFFFMEEFKKGFGNNFGAGIIYWLIDFVVIASVIAGYYVYPQRAAEEGTSAYYILFGISLAVALVLLCMNYYIFALQATTGLRKRSVLKNSFQLVGLSLKQCGLTTLCIALVIFLMVFLFSLTSYVMFLLPFMPAAFIGYLVMFIHYPVIQKYVIFPYYETSDEQNPDLEEETPEEERVFTDRGGTETPVKAEKPKKGRIIS